MPEFCQKHPRYERMGLRDLCQHVHEMYAKYDIAILTTDMYLSDLAPAMRPSDAYAHIAQRKTERVEIDHLEGRITVEQVADDLSALADTMIELTMQWAWSHFKQRHRSVEQGPGLAVIAYGVGANICYTGGWISEALVRKIWQERTGAFGQIAFVLGLVFSVLITLAPAAFFSVLLTARLLLR